MFVWPNLYDHNAVIVVMERQFRYLVIQTHRSTVTSSAILERLVGGVLVRAPLCVKCGVPCLHVMQSD